MPTKRVKPVCEHTGNKCGFVLPDGTSNIVFGEGPLQAPLVLVGEAPGRTELRVKRPFVGPAGELLERALLECGLRRDGCYITNACLCCSDPPKTPGAPEWRACRDRLIREIRNHSPHVVVALGAVATRSLIGERRIKESRGDVVQSGELGAYVIPTIHPAAVLRDPRLYQDLCHDLRKAASIARGDAVVRAPEPVVHIVRKHEDLDALMESAELAVDTEGDILCVGMSNDGKNVYIVPGDALEYDHSVRSRLSAVLNSAGKIVAHNWNYDARVLAPYGTLRNRPPFADTMLAAYTLDERRGTHGLKYLAREYLHTPRYDDAVRPYMTDGNLAECPQEVLYNYNAMDVVSTYHLHHRMEEMLDADQRWVLDNLLIPATYPLAEMSHRGILVDADLLTRLGADMESELVSVWRLLCLLAGDEFNPNSWKQVASILYERLELPVPFRYSTDSAALETLVQHTGHPFPQAFLRYRELHKLLSTYVRGLLDAQDTGGRVHTNFNLTGTVTGRLSSSSPVNLQNIPRDSAIRNAFVASPGYTLLECDQSQSEIRCFCLLSRDEALREVILAGGDIHKATACLMFGLKPEEVTPEQRQAAKRLSFATLYGMTAVSLAQNLNVSVAEAEELQQKFFAAYDQGREWIEQVQSNALATGEYITPFRRKLRFGPATKENRNSILRDAVNYPVQSMSADVTLSALIRIDQRVRRGELGDTRFLLTVHDSILLETAEDVREVARAVKEEMERPVGDGFVHFEAEVKAGARWGSLKEIKL